MSDTIPTRTSPHRSGCRWTVLRRFHRRCARRSASCSNWLCFCRTAKFAAALVALAFLSAAIASRALANVAMASASIRLMNSRSSGATGCAPFRRFLYIDRANCLSVERVLAGGGALLRRQGKALQTPHVTIRDTLGMWQKTLNDEFSHMPPFIVSFPYSSPRRIEFGLCWSVSPPYESVVTSMVRIRWRRAIGLFSPNGPKVF